MRLIQRPPCVFLQWPGTQTTGELFILDFRTFIGRCSAESLCWLFVSPLGGSVAAALLLWLAGQVAKYAAAEPRNSFPRRAAKERSDAKFGSSSSSLGRDCEITNSSLSALGIPSTVEVEEGQVRSFVRWFVRSITIPSSRWMRSGDLCLDRRFIVAWGLSQT